MSIMNKAPKGKQIVEIENAGAHSREAQTPIVDGPLKYMARIYMGAIGYPAYVWNLNPLTVTIDFGNHGGRQDYILPQQHLEPYEDNIEERYTVKELRIVRVPDNPGQGYTDQWNSKEVPMEVDIPKVKHWTETRDAEPIGNPIKVGDAVKVSTYGNVYTGTLTNMDPVVIDHTYVVNWTRHTRVERA